jgi:hypothetical protein
MMTSNKNTYEILFSPILSKTKTGEKNIDSNIIIRFEDYDKLTDSANSDNSTDSANYDKLTDMEKTIEIKYLGFIFQNSSGLRIFLQSPNKRYSLCANVFGDVWISSSCGEIRWIFKSVGKLFKNFNDTDQMGEPNISYTSQGQFVFLLDSHIVFSTYAYSVNSIVKKPQIKYKHISKYHVEQVIDTDSIQTICRTTTFCLDNKGNIQIITPTRIMN